MVCVSPHAGRKGQLSVEALILLGIVLAVGIVLFMYANDAVRDFNVRLASSQGRHAVSKTADAAVRVYRQGDGARDTLWLYLPKGTRSFSASGQTLTLVLDAGTTSEIYESLAFNVTGSLDAGEGLLKVRLNSTSVGVVMGAAP